MRSQEEWIIRVARMPAIRKRLTIVLITSRIKPAIYEKNLILSYL